VPAALTDKKKFRGFGHLHSHTPSLTPAPLRVARVTEKEEGFLGF
jgi:hypothetical protein